MAQVGWKDLRSSAECQANGTTVELFPHNSTADDIYHPTQVILCKKRHPNRICVSQAISIIDDFVDSRPVAMIYHDNVS